MLKKPNFIDKTVEFFAPIKAAKRLRARMTMDFLGSYQGADKTRRSLKEWTTLGNDPDTDILADLETLRERSRDLYRNNPIAASIIKTKLTNTIGTGLRLQSRIDRDAIGLSDDQADEWESITEREWRLFWESKDVDAARTLNGHGQSRQIYQQEKENGDVFVLLPKIKRLGCPYDLKLQVIEADRVCNKNDIADTETLAGGIERDKNGAPINYHILNQHPGSYLNKRQWTIVPAFGPKTGIRNIIHLFNPTRPGQSRGVPDLSPVIEPIKQLGRYTDNEVMAAVVAGLFTVFIKTEKGDGGFDFTNISDETGQTVSDKDKKLGNGLMIDLAEGESIDTANPGRPNSSFDPFVISILKQIGSAVEIPFEILTKHFASSYSAARAALLQLWNYVLSERRWFEDNFLKPVYEVWMYEAIAKERIAAPGFLVDPALRAAYLGCKFIGPSKGQINEQAEVRAAAERINNGLSTLADETSELTGRDWEQNHKQQVKERKRRLEDGLIIGQSEVNNDEGNQPD